MLLEKEFFNLFSSNKTNMKIGDIVLVPSEMKEAKIIAINKNIATVKGKVKIKEYHKEKEAIRKFPLTALRKLKYSSINLSEENKFGNLIKWNKISIEKSELFCSLLSLYQKYNEDLIDLNPIYQRDLVWTKKQKEEYILAILKSTAEITPTLVQEYNEEKKEETFEVLDGKQRLTSLFDFIEDKFKVKGKLFSELSSKDVIKILYYDVKYIRLISFTDKIPLDFKLNYFLMINAKGTKISNKDIKKVEDLLKKNP